MAVNNLQGMRYPCEAIIRFFYKEKLNLRKGAKVLEIGCGSANNLLHFSSYGWDVTGIDYSNDSLSMAEHNLKVNGASGKFITHDLQYPVPILGETYDLFLAPNVLYYLSREAAIQRLQEINSLLNKDAFIFIRMRLPDDHRYGRGTNVGKAAWKFDFSYTGELGLSNVFWTEYELVDLFRDSFGISFDALTILKFTYENIQNDMIIKNSDIVIWGRK